MTGKMKKTILFAMIVAVLGFTACNKENTTEPETPQEGMVLCATVEQPTDSKATFTDNEGVWHFDFEDGDIIKVTNSEIGYNNFYTFTYDGDKFVSADAVPTDKPARWYAYFPSNDVSLVGQSGKWEDIADMYVMTGSTPYGSGDVTGKDGLSITMSPKVAILKIINQKGDIDINVLMGKDIWVSGYKTSLLYTSSSLDLYSKETKQTLLSTTETGTYYIAVPTSYQLVIKDGDEVVKSTGTSGLQAGKYYEVTIHLPTKGKAAVKSTAGIAGNEVSWIQLWEDGPKFAEYNLGVEDGNAESFGGYYTWGGTYKNGEGIEWKDDHNGTYYYTRNLAPADDTATKIWGDNWRMPTKDELEALMNSENCTCTDTKQNGVRGLLFTGKKGTVFEANIVFLPSSGYCYNTVIDSIFGYYWSSTSGETTGTAHCLEGYLDGPRMSDKVRRFGYSVRAVLNE